MNANPISDILLKFNEVVKTLNDIKTRKKASINTLTSLAGISKTQVAELLNGNLTRKKDGKRNFSNAVIERLYRDLVARKEPVATAPFVNLTKIAQNTQRNACMSCVVGKTGVGKSTAIKHLLREQSNMYYILCDHLTTELSLFEQVAQVLGLKSEWEKLKGKARKKAIIEAIADFANKQDSPVLLALDDMHHFNTIKVYQDLKWLFDITEGALGILLIGTHNLEENLKKWAGYDLEWNERYKSKNIMPEFVRRFKGDFQRLPAVSEQDLKLICQAQGVQDSRIWKAWAKKTNLDLGTFCTKLENALAFECNPQSPVIFDLMN